MVRRTGHFATRYPRFSGISDVPGAIGISIAASASNSGDIARWVSQGRSKESREHVALPVGQSRPCGGGSYEKACRAFSFLVFAWSRST